MKHRYQIVGIFSLLSLVLVAGFLFSERRSAAAGEETVEQILWGPYWTVQPGFTSTLEMKNNRAEETLPVQVSLYFANGEEYYLDPMQLGPRQTVVIDLNHIIESLPASVAARAGREGTLEVVHNGANFQALMGSVSVTNPEQGIAWVFRLYPSAPDFPVVPVRGLFWFPDENTDGFIAVQNASEEYIDVSPLFHIAGESHSAPSFRLAPGQGSKLELRKELRRLGLEQVTAGGIEFTYEGPSDALKLHGVLFNNQGFSTEIDFHLQNTGEEERVLTMRTPRFGIGRADPALGLPTTTTFEPTLALHNFAKSELAVTLSVGYRTEEGAQELQIPLVLSAGDTEVLSLHPYLEGVVPEEARWASLEISYTARENALAAELVSVSADGEHSIRSVMNWVQGNASEGWLWRADADHNTYIAMYNADTEEATVKVSLDYYVEGQHHSYDLPEMAIPARASDMVDVGAILAAGLPDADGDVIPSEVGFGGYSVRKRNRLHTVLTTEALVFDRRSKIYLTFYNTCCDYTGFVFIPTSISGPVGASVQMSITALNNCTFAFEDLTVLAGYNSNNSSVASVNGSGRVSLVSPGSATITATVSFSGADPFCRTRICTTCVPRIVSDTTPVTVKPRIDNITPSRSTVALRASGSLGPNTSEIEGSGTPSGGNFQWSTSSGKITLTTLNNTRVRVTSVAASGSQNDILITVTYTVNNQTSDPFTFNITVVKPTSLSIVSGTSSTTAEASCTTPGGLAGCGVTRTFKYQVRDQFTLPIQVGGMPIWDSIQAGAPNGCNLVGFTTTCSPPNTGPCNKVTFGNGQFDETLSICAPACRSTTGVCIVGCETAASQTWNVNGFPLTADLKQLSYQCDRILANNQ